MSNSSRGIVSMVCVCVCGGGGGGGGVQQVWELLAYCSKSDYVLSEIRLCSIQDILSWPQGVPRILHITPNTNSPI